MDLFHDKKKGKSSLKHMCLFHFLSLVPSSSSTAGEKNNSNQQKGYHLVLSELMCFYDKYGSEVSVLGVMSLQYILSMCLFFLILVFLL